MWASRDQISRARVVELTSTPQPGPNARSARIGRYGVIYGGLKNAAVMSTQKQPRYPILADMTDSHAPARIAMQVDLTLAQGPTTGPCRYCAQPVRTFDGQGLCHPGCVAQVAEQAGLDAARRVLTEIDSPVITRYVDEYHDATTAALATTPDRLTASSRRVTS